MSGWTFVRPLRHFRDKNVQPSVAIHVAKLQAVTVDNVAVEQVAGLPVRRVFRVTAAFVPPQLPPGVARRNNNLRKIRGLEAAGKNQSSAERKPDLLELFAAGALERGIAREYVDWPSASTSQADAPSMYGTPAVGVGEHRGERPCIGGAGIRRNLRQEKCGGLLVPERELGLAHAQEIAKHLVVVLRLTTGLDSAALPGSSLSKWGAGFSHHHTSLLCQSPPKTRSRSPSPSMSAAVPPASMVR